MPRYQVTRDYEAYSCGRWYRLEAGSEVEIDADEAAWIERDAPGTITEIGEASGGVPAAAAPVFTSADAAYAATRPGERGLHHADTGTPAGDGQVEADTVQAPTAPEAPARPRRTRSRKA